MNSVFVLPFVLGAGMAWSLARLANPYPNKAAEDANVLADHMEITNLHLERVMSSSHIPELGKDLTGAFCRSCFDKTSHVKIYEGFRDLREGLSPLVKSLINSTLIAALVTKDEESKKIWLDCVLSALDVASLQSCGETFDGKELIVELVSEPTSMWSKIVDVVSAIDGSPPALPRPATA